MKRFTKLFAAILMVSILCTPVQGASTSEISAPPMSTAVNDVIFPLQEYPADVLIYSGSYPSATSFFSRTSTTYATCDHRNGVKKCKYYGGHSQCFGFAVYAHDVYMHIVDTSKKSEGWAAGDYFGTDIEMNSEADFQNFFQSLNPGAYIRYGKDDDDEAPEGAHSIVYIGCDKEGVWVYECNQDYKCGVYLTYYLYKDLIGRYDFIANYVNHTFSAAEYENTSTHTVPCANCDGYLRQTHSDVTGPACQNRLWHITTYGCCDGAVSERHTATGVVAKYNFDAHKITYSCCSGFATVAHTFTTDANPVCTVCGSPKVESVVTTSIPDDPELTETFQ